jgi:hypothetical protein
LVRNACAALAVGDGGRYGWGWASDLATAQQSAQNACANSTCGCQLRAWVCT